VVMFGNHGTNSLMNQTVFPFPPLSHHTLSDDHIAPHAGTGLQTAGPSDKGVPWPLQLDDNELPILPSSEDRSLLQVKQVVRSFLTLTYRQSIPLSHSIICHITTFRPCI
jgi:hypothetical protein